MTDLERLELALRRTANKYKLAPELDDFLRKFSCELLNVNEAARIASNDEQYTRLWEIRETGGHQQ